MIKKYRPDIYFKSPNVGCQHYLNIRNADRLRPALIVIRFLNGGSGGVLFVGVAANLCLGFSTSVFELFVLNSGNIHILNGDLVREILTLDYLQFVEKHCQHSSHEK